MVGRIVPRLRFDDVRWVEDTDSTNSRLLDEARAGAPEGVVLVADHQTAGRGRLGRRWQAPPGSSLLVSVLVRPPVPLARAHLVTMAAGLAASDACQVVAGVRPGLKWPNDLVLDDAKLAGLLAESVVEGDALRALVVGMGLNVTAAPAEGATALAHHTGDPVERRPLLDAWLSHLDARLDDLDGVLADYRPRCATLGRDVHVVLPDRELEGRAVDVTDAGHLVLDTATGRVDVTVGDVVHVRPSRGGPRTPW
jgi:BirA family transcriptional regulator, biotin operon repressor / biotin---[acetyl-CoA-carboxylase] ligase